MMEFVYKNTPFRELLFLLGNPVIRNSYIRVMRHWLFLSVLCVLGNFSTAQQKYTSSLQNFPLEGRIVLNALAEQDVAIRTIGRAHV